LILDISYYFAPRTSAKGIPFERGYIPPMKMDGYQNKGVAGRAFCKRLKRDGMDDGKSRRSNRVAAKKEGDTPFAENALGKGGGCTPPVGKEGVCKRMKGKRIEAFPLSHDGNDGPEMY
jgi:hypothetical protein